MMATFRMAAGAALLALALPVLAANAPGADVQAIERGRYLATAGDCIACHSVPGGKPMAGGLSLATPLGAIVATNITPSTTHGIGNYTLKQFSDAVRHGVRADGAHLYPAMPYTAYARVTDDDTAALYAYFMHGVAAVDTAPATQTDLPFPFNIRLSMAGWNWLFLDKKPFVADAAKSMEWNRGAYLAQGLAHCSTCHTPRNALMAEQLSKELGGFDLGTWFAPNITSDANSGIGSWSQQDLVDYLRTGRAAHRGQAAGPMAEAIDHSLKHLSDADLDAIAHYIKSVPAIRDKADTKPVTQWGQAGDELDAIRGVPLPQELNKMSGAQLYDAQCASCHQAKGEGSFDGSLPPLFHNSVTGRSNSNNLVMAILDGVERQDGKGNHTAGHLMPAFRQTLSDEQIVTLGNYVQKMYGNPDVKVTAEQVTTLRNGGRASNLIGLARAGIIVGVLVLLALLLWWRGRRRKETSAA
ncbi:fructose dehydrogenase cytochrome subunit precursor [Janthinobacterium sp. HH103]|uniref:c-type cytochrome n=1 Tax=unclassified Janthinobacterium TaxID=2610881 RepID=UPI000873F2DE|nr:MULTISPECIES: cytochrome c [unclassified Janthinobacterium]OEZ72629.1 fructose dehydrogenase cytochrome subunit precursor [Janthinobacterium sp. HH100]OEZ86871.1 fructose dehydrogenase cytochrome subunit precursor [Janthinobacterium sp. HH103]QOU73977.1 Fructose dehydrogenase cytochrome subunit [Janthinobacterium sp. HH102]